MKNLKTIYPEAPIKDYNEWIAWLNGTNLSPEDKFEANFMRIWSQYKDSIVQARTKKSS
jgi:hypothetical protein|tara:strand:- start:392 stop:568 length:177 start_codon:yes stop_codon:yes gene_type:complete